MPNQAIASLHNYSNRFLRSTDLVRDFDDPQGLSGYWLTDFGRSCLSRISDGFRPDSGRRAWRLTGDFGAGKSSFALLVANSASDARHRLPKHLFNQVVEELPEAKKLRFVPVLVTATRERMAPAILRAILKVFGSLYSRRGIRSELETQIENLLLNPDQITDRQAVELIEKTNRKIIQNGKGSGILLILDEVGKFLEFAAQSPEEQDVYFLQQLGEMAARSGSEPVVVVCLLHQGFNAYAEQLAPSSQREWEKIAGRFEEIVFRQPLDQVALLIAAALNVDENKLPTPLKKQAMAALDAGIACGWFGTSASPDTLRQLAHRLFPLDPLLLPVLVRIFQRFGQNERSLFSFLCSYEPFGLRAFSNNPLSRTSRPYQLADFYDYIRANFGHRLAVASYRTHWSVIESKIDAHPADNELETRTLKTVGVLNLLNSDDLRPTRDAVCWAVAGHSEENRRQVSKLLRKIEGRDLHFRGESRGYSLWPYTSVDIDARLDEAKRAIPQVVRVADAIKQQLNSRPIVARAHYIETGNLRYFDVVYCEPAELEQQAAEPRKGQSDGIILVPLCETKQERNVALQAARQTKERDDLIQIIAVPKPLNHLNQAALDALRWEWVQEKTSELNNDPYARNEVQLHLQEARNRLQNQIQEFIGLNRVGQRVSLSWFYHGERIQHQTGRQVMRWLSTRCDQVFHSAPNIRNELVNRHNLSSAAAAARMRLIERMLTHSESALLGMDPTKKPPEMSIYLSVLAQTKIHRFSGDQWILSTPPRSNDPCRFLPALAQIRQILDSRPDERVCIESIFQDLRRPPFGIRGGLLPILLVVVLTEYHQEIALYENGTFLSHVGPEEILRLTKRPAAFDLQMFRLKGVRLAVFEDLLGVLITEKASQSKSHLLDIVRPLCTFVAELPQYARITVNLSENARRVRDAILNAREPGTLLFKELPTACGFTPFNLEARPQRKEDTARQFAQALKIALEELRMAFPRLKDRMRDAIASAFEQGTVFDQTFRDSLAERSENLVVNLRDLDLKAFCLRVLDNNLPESDWLESVGSVLASTPPSLWKDDDEVVFKEKLQEMVHKFCRVESVAFAGFGRKPAGSLFRVALTARDGQERDQVVHLNENEEREGKDLEENISKLLGVNTRVSTCALSRLMWKLLEKNNERSPN